MKRIFTLMLMWAGVAAHADMNKTDLIAEVATAAEVDQATAERVVDALTDVITQGLKRNERVGLVGFGTFYVKERAARIGRNPSTGEQTHIPARRSLVFKPGKTLKEAINEGNAEPSPESEPEAEPEDDDAD